MTRKDYVLIAEVLKNFKGDGGDVIDRDQISYKLAQAFQTQNSRFDMYRFLLACDYLSEQREGATTPQ